MRLDKGEIIPRNETFQNAETAGVLTQDQAKVCKPTQPVPIQKKRLLNAACEQSLLNQHLVLIQNRSVPGLRFWVRFEAGRQLGAHRLVDGLRFGPQEIT